jgi:membrane associated rhomboid family serine protease
LSKQGLSEGKIWQIFTFQFLHANLLHLIFNMAGLYMFGRMVEDQMGQKSFLKLYFVSGVIGGLSQVVFSFISPEHSGAVMGASAGVYGVIAAFSLIYWYQRFKVLIFFFIPAELSGQFVFWLSLVSSLIGLVLGANATVDGPQIAHAAHLGGFFSAFIFVRRGSAFAEFGRWIPTHRSSDFPEESMVEAGTVKKPLWKKTVRVPKEEEVHPEDFISKQVDPILDKISAKGIHSLTEQERKILEKARSKMSKR